MSNKYEKSFALKKSKGLNPLQLFKRTLHNNKNLRKGLAKARTVVAPSNFPMIVRELSRTSIYKSLMAPITFPLLLTDLSQQLRLQEISTEGELIWSASVLSLYADRLKNFVKYRDDYYTAYINADYDQAEEILDLIQQSLGFSIWLLRNRIQLLQITKGLQAQKTLLEDILSTKGINQFIAWLAYFLSIRSEDSVSYASFESELEGVLEINWLRDYARLHLLPVEFSSIENPATPISIEESHPIIDRFETFVAMTLSYCARNNRENCSIVVSSLEQLEAIDDISIKRMLMILRDGYSAGEGQFLRYADAYTEGRYEDILDGGCNGLEIMARAYGYLGCCPLNGDMLSLREQLIAHIYNVSALSADAALSRQKLKKLALLCPDRSITLEVVAFLQRGYDHFEIIKPSNLDVAAAISRPLDNPWSAAAFGEIADEITWLSQVINAYPESSALQLRLALAIGNPTLLEQNKIQMPSYRQAMYLGHINFRAGHFDIAIDNYLSAAASNIDFVSHAAKRSLFKTYYAIGELYQAVQLAIEHALQTPSSAPYYPLERLARTYLKHENRNPLDLALLLHLAIRYCNAKLERDLSIAYERVMEAEALNRPSDFREVLEKYNKHRVIYFLRYICIPRILDDSIYFNSVEEIDQERITVCQLLLTLDPNNIETYQAEICSITRASEVASLLSKIQTSNIYVDEAGIRESLEASLAEPLTRYRKLLCSPTIAYQTEKLSKRIGEMLSNKGHPEFKDLKLPATALEGLFNTMLLEAVTDFALNPAYGLDTHVSTSIRHGAFEGHLRRPLALEGLLCLKKDKEYVLPSTWARKLPSLGAAELDILQKLLSRFSQRFEDIVYEYLKRKLHIRLVGDDVAMFDFVSSPTESQSLMDGITPNTSLNDLTDRFIAHCWELTTRSLDSIRLDLLNYASKQMSSAFDSLVRGAESNIGHAIVTPFIDSVARARTEFQTAIEDVAGWFQRPTDLSRDPFEIEVAIHVALQQISNCYIGNILHPLLELEVQEKIDGRMLDGFCEILFILLQNAIRHSGFSDDNIDVHISAKREDEALIIRCKNSFSKNLSIPERRQCALDAMGQYKCDLALKMARKEGGSGLSKVWRIAEFDLHVQHAIELSVTDNHEFVVALSLVGVWA